MAGPITPKGLFPVLPVWHSDGQQKSKPTRRGPHLKELLPGEEDLATNVQKAQAFRAQEGRPGVAAGTRRVQRRGQPVLREGGRSG